MLKHPVFIKLGGSILTDKTQPESVNVKSLQAVAASVAAFRRTRPDQPLLIGHGGGSFGHYWAERYATHRGIVDATSWNGFARVADAMGRLNRMVVKELLGADVNAVSMQPSASAFARDGVLMWLDVDAIKRVLGAGLVPVLYGDAVLDQQQGVAIASTEHIFAFLAPQLLPQRIVLVGEIGVFTADPRQDRNAVRIPLINSTNIDAVLSHTAGSHGTDVTGGMSTKVGEMWRLVQTVPGLEVQLIGTDAAAVERALNGTAEGEGTIITL